MPLQEPPSLSSFDEAAQEAAASRMYGGIHFPFDNDDGLSAGQCVGQVILERIAFKRWSGREVYDRRTRSSAATLMRNVRQADDIPEK